MKFTAKTDKNRKLVCNRVAISAYISRWKPHTELEISITRRMQKDPIRIAYFVHILPPFMEHLGYERSDSEMFHRQLKCIYFKGEYNLKPDKFGVVKNIPAVFSDGSKMSGEDKHKFIDWVVRTAAREGCYIDVKNKKSRAKPDA